MVKITASVTPQWIAANERAYQNRLAGRVVTMVRPGTYTAPSSKGDGTTYTVMVTNVGTLSATCSCPHGTHGTAGKCWHSAAAIAAEVRRTAPKTQVSRQEMMARMSRFHHS